MKQKTDKRVTNDADIERQWAESAFRYAELYESVLLKTGAFETRKIRLTASDDRLMERYDREFRSMPVEVLNVDELKSQASKLRWYNFLETNKTLAKDYNMGTLIRVDVRRPFGPENSVVVPRLQFYCIELKRCRLGMNEAFVQSFGAKEQPAQAPAEAGNQPTPQSQQTPSGNAEQKPQGKPAARQTPLGEELDALVEARAGPESAALKKKLAQQAAAQGQRIE